MKITDNDLFLIRDSAINFMTALSSRSKYQQNLSQAQTYAFTKAVVMYLNKHNCLNQEVDVDENFDPRYTKD